MYYLPDTNVIKMFKNNLDVFKEHWTFHTKDYNCLKIKDSHLFAFFDKMEEPLGMSSLDKNEVIKEIVKMDLQSDKDGFIYFNELLFKTMRRKYGDERVLNKQLAI